MARDATITVRILGDSKDALRAINETETELKGFGSRIGTAGKAIGAGIAAGVAAAGVFGAQAIDSASNLDESMSKVSVVFGDASKDVVAWSKTSATAFGQSQQQALEAAGTYGNLFQAFGLGQKPAQEMSQSLVELAADLASFNNTSVDDALQALQSGLSGETEPLKKFGVALSDARLKEQALAMGLIKSTKDALSPAAKAQAAYALIMKDTTLAQGDFARTSDGLANKQRVLGAKFEDLKAQIGTKLLPVMLQFVSFLTDKVIPAAAKVVAWFERNWPAIRKAVLDAVQPIIDWFKRNWPEIERTVRDVLDSVRRIVEAVWAAVSAIWRQFGDEIMQYVGGMFETIKATIEGALKVIQGVIQTITALIRGDWDEAWEGIKKIVDGVWTAIKGIVSGALDQIKAMISAAWDVVKGVATTAWEGIKTAVSNGVDGVVGFARGLPGRVVEALGDLTSLLWAKGTELIGGLWEGAKALWFIMKNWLIALPGNVLDAIGDLSNLLYEIGKSVIKGFLDGMKSAWGGAKDWLKGRAIEILHLKGPPEKDAVLLVKSGQLIMDGLLKGMRQGWGNVESFLGGATVAIPAIAGGDGGSISAMPSPLPTGTAGVAPTVTFVVNMDGYKGDGYAAARDFQAGIKQFVQTNGPGEIKRLLGL